MPIKITPAVEKVEEAAKTVLLKNRKTVTKKGVTYGFTCPSVTLYHWQWLWDSCFHAIALRWFDPEFAKGEIISLLSGQWEDGRVPNMVHVGWNWRCDRIVHGTGRDTSGITQPPIIADAALRVYETTHDIAFLRKVYEPLKKYYAWLGRERDTKGDGLIAIYHPWESGIDNSPRWDEIFNIEKFSRKKFDLVKGVVMFRFNFARYRNDAMRRVSPYFVKGIDMNCYYHSNLRAMAAIARILGAGADADDFELAAQKTKDSINRRMWDAEKNFYGDLVGEEERLSAVPTPFSFLPLWAGVADEQRKKAILDALFDKSQFWLDYPVATTSAQYPAFEQDGYWRGTVWININWFMADALARNGHKDKSDELIERTVEMIGKSGFFEYYNPYTGKGLGTENFGWSTLVIDMIRRDFETQL